MVVEGSPTTWLGWRIRKAFGASWLVVTAPAGTLPLKNLGFGKVFVGGKVPSGFAGLAGFGFSWLNHSANNCVKLTKTLVTIWGF